MFSGGIFLNEVYECIASFGQFSILPLVDRGLKFGQANIHRWWRSNFSPLLLFHRVFFFDKGVVTEPVSAAQVVEVLQLVKQPAHVWPLATVNANEARV